MCIRDRCLPEPPVPVAAYLPSVVFSNNLVYVSGQDCRKDGQLLYKGKLGSDLTVDQGKECARQSMCNCLAALKYSIGDLDRVKRIVKVLGQGRGRPVPVEKQVCIFYAVIHDYLKDVEVEACLLYTSRCV